MLRIICQAVRSLRLASPGGARTPSRRCRRRPPSLAPTIVQRLERRVLLSATQIAGTFSQGGKAFDVHIDSIGANGIDPSRNTWVLIHGWNSDPTVWATKMGASIAAKYPGDTVLTFDWSSAANTGLFQPGLAESRIQPAAAWLAEQLVAAGFSPANLNFIGHSFGAYVGSEAAERVGGLARSIIALDPAQDIGGGFNPENPAEVNFSADAQYSWAFLDGSSSNFGSSIAAATAAESFVVKGGSHSQYFVLQNILDAPTTASQWFELDDLASSAPWEVDQFNDAGSPTSSGGRNFEALITLKSDKATIASTAWFPLGDAARLASRTPQVFLPPAPPVVASFGSTIKFKEAGAAVLLTTGATVKDADSPNFDTGRLVVQISANGQASDLLAIRDQGTAAGKIGLSGTDVTFGGTIIGSFTGGDGTNPLVVTFNSLATPAVAQALLRNITFANTSTSPSTAARTIRVTLFDGDGGASSAVSKSATVTAVNTRPTIDGFDPAVTFAAGGGPVRLDDDATIDDPDSANLANGKLTVQLVANGNANDRLAILNQGTADGQVGTSGRNVTFGGVIIGTFSGGTGTAALAITFNTKATPAIAQAVLRCITFNNVSATPTTAARTVRATLTDGDGGTSLAASKTINIA